VKSHCSFLRGAMAISLLSFAVGSLVGCGSGERYAPVSGVVTLNGEPLADAKLIFEPIGGEGGVGAGKPSYGRTDENGRYTVSSPIANKEGAAVGEHRVRIVTVSGVEYTEEQMASARQRLEREEVAGGGAAENVTDERVRAYLSDRAQPVQRESLPARYNSNTELRITVPPNGTESANFELTTP
jgi:hypothetical protein